jgi:glyoxylase-like metal-dependent hydrolase (beta-lactamase superfamily II)
MNTEPPPLLDYPFAAPPALGTTIEVAPGIRWLRMPLPFALDHVNLWLLDGQGSRLIVDCGYGNAATRAAWDLHAKNAFAQRAPTGIVATHFHPDHLGNAAWLSARYGIGVTMTLGEWLTAHYVHAATADPLLPLFAAHGLASEQTNALMARSNRYHIGAPELPSHYTRIIDGDRLSAADTQWEVIAGYGHAPEHASLYTAERRILISGDMLLPRISTNVSIPAVEPDGDPLRRFLDSLTRFEALPADTLVLPSHGLPFRGAALRVAQLRAHHAARLTDLADHVRAARTPVAAADVLSLLFRRELDVQQTYFAMGEAIAHLNHLWHRGQLARQVGGDGQIRFTANA